jgi:hypothetical protein
MSRDFMGFMLVAAKLFVKKPENDKAKAPLKELASTCRWIMWARYWIRELPKNLTD